MQLRVLLLIISLGFSLILPAQTWPYSKNYFRNPLGVPMDLQSNFGELRPDHWHMGLDLRTNARENYPVYAAAVGYIAKVGIRPKSFGRFIIINHPNGLSTLYAHLNDFYPELEKYVTEQQYKQESWAVELNMTKNQFPVSNGSFIAYSGNTGGSQGPHLHFEIFVTQTGRRLNPLLFDFPVLDNLAPSFVKLAIYDRSKSTFEQSPLIYSLKKTDSGYILPRIPVLKTGMQKISFAIQAYDKMNKSKSEDGIYLARLLTDGKTQIQFSLDSIDYDETVLLNAHVDYKYRYYGGPWLQHLSQLPGDHGQVYKQIGGDGILRFEDTLVHTVTIEIKDAANNSAFLNFAVQYDDSLPVKSSQAAENVKLIPNQVNTISKPDFEMNLPAASLYDTVGLVYFRNNGISANAVSAAHQVNDASVPLNNDISVMIKPGKLIPDGWKDKIVIQRSGRGSAIKKARWINDWLTAGFGDLGTFQAFVDTVPPQINELGKSDTINLSGSSAILFKPTDNFGVIQNFRVMLDSQWLRFTNDKGRNWLYVFDERCPYGVHQLSVSAKDLAGNITQKSWWFKRYPYTPPVKKKKAVKTKSGKENTKPKKIKKK